MCSRAAFTPVPTLFPSPELRILLLCGSDLLESFCIPGLWNEADVSSKVPTAAYGAAREGWGGGTWFQPLLFPPPNSLPSQPECPISCGLPGQSILVTMEESSHRSQA